MPSLRFTKDHVAIVKNQLDPGWYACKITECVYKPNKKGDANLWELKFVVLTKEDGTAMPTNAFHLRSWFSEKEEAIPYHIPFFEALAGGEIKEEEEYSFDASVGHTILVRTEQELYNNRVQSKVAGFRPFKG